jgi:superfamily II DNA or RNA helicase
LLQNGDQGRILCGSANLTKDALESGLECNTTKTVSTTDAAWKKSDEWFSDCWERASNHPLESAAPTATDYPDSCWRRDHLFEYQREAVEHLHRNRRRRALLVLPTGAGKTAVVACWLRERLRDEGQRLSVLWIAPQHELLRHARDEALRFGISEDRMYHARTKDDLRILVGSKRAGVRVSCVERYQLVFMTTDLLRALPNWTTDILVFDEAHHMNPRSGVETKAILRVRSQTLLGLTATPWRTSTDEHREFVKLFGGLHDHVFFLDERNEKDRARLVGQDGTTPVLAQRKHHPIETKFGFEFRAQDRHNRPLELQARIRDFDDRKRNETIVRQYYKWAATHRPSRTLVFACTNDHANALGRAFCKLRRGTRLKVQVFHTGNIPRSTSPDYFSGDKIFSLSHRANQTHDFRHDVLSLFNAGEINVLVVVGLATEGIDLPATDCIVVARPTLSAKLYRQMVGRGLRGPAVGGSQEVHILDCVDQMKDHDKVVDAIYGDKAYSQRC